MYQYRTDMYEGLLAETITIAGHHGDSIGAYFARPLTAGPHPGVVLIHHAPGWDDWYHEATLRFARRGYVALCPDLYHRAGHGSAEDVAAMVRNAGGVPDDQVVEDMEGGMRYLRSLPHLNGKVGVIGSCSGGRHAYLVACRAAGVDAIVDLWGGGVVARPEDLNEEAPGRADRLHEGPHRPAARHLRERGSQPHAGAGEHPRGCLKAAGQAV